MINCIIVDDEPLALELLEDNINKIPFLKLVAKCANAIEATSVIHSMQVDLVFTDIQMPGVNGIQFMETLLVKPMFIITTAYERFALDGFELNVVDYLLKPFSFDRFLKASNRAFEMYHLRNGKQSANQPSPGHIFAYVDYSQVKIILEEIMYIEAVKDYIKFHFVNNSKPPLLVRMSMKSIEEQLPSDKFVRIHKSFIVNSDSVTAIRKNSVFIGKLEFSVSEQYKGAIGQLIGKPQ
jgi:two-component system LytT family response regulator